MDFLTGSTKGTWQPVMTGDTTTASYWLNWRVLLCSIWILMSMGVASYLITKYEGPPRNDHGRTRFTRRGERSHNGEEEEEEEEENLNNVGVVYDDQVWRPCLRGVHPAWLLAFRLVAFFVLLILLIFNGVLDGGDIFYYYTQWTFTSITIYFGLGSLLSMQGCYEYHNRVGGDALDDAEQGSRVAAAQSKYPKITTWSGPNEDRNARKIAGFWGYVFQIMFQMNAGAVVLTDCVFWFIIVPFLTIRDYNLNFLIINMHTINAVFLFSDTVLNSLQFHWFRIAYFFLWTAIYVVFQWIVHACIALWWPYPFLDLSSPFSPLWYSSVALLHIPCYGVFILVMKLKHFLMLKWFPDSYQYEE